jgi:hypothetical protein
MELEESATVHVSFICISKSVTNMFRDELDSQTSYS